MNKGIITILLISATALTFSACSSSKVEKEEKEETEFNKGARGALIMDAARDEQKKEMYSKNKDSTYLYWLDNKLVLLKKQTKCNIYALNVLYVSGFMTPDENALSRDLFDTLKYTDVLPVVGISDPGSAEQGDLIIWKGHVIIFDRLVEAGKELYAQAWWAGTRQPDNGDNILNNVCYGKYRLTGSYVVRRPVSSRKGVK